MLGEHYAPELFMEFLLVEHLNVLQKIEKTYYSKKFKAYSLSPLVGNITSFNFMSRQLKMGKPSMAKTFRHSNCQSLS